MANIPKSVFQGSNCKGKGFDKEYRKMVRLVKAEGTIRRNVQELRQDRAKTR